MTLKADLGSVISPQSYMEDHLKNKNRLEREWEALCSYQAEPGAWSVGHGEQNSRKNRSDAVVVCESSLMSIFLLGGFEAKNKVLNLEITQYLALPVTCSGSQWFSECVFSLE